MDKASDFGGCSEALLLLGLNIDTNKQAPEKAGNYLH